MSTRWLGSSHSASQGNVCVVLAYSAGGAALMNTWLFMVHASLFAYLLMTTLWLPMVLLDAPLVHVKADTGVSSIGWPIVLLITGSSLGLLIVLGSTVLLGIAIYRHYVGFMFLPLAAWTLAVAALCALLGTAPKKLSRKRPERAAPVPAEP